MPDLPKQTLGRTGLVVTTLGYGALEMRNTADGSAFTEADAKRVLNAVIDCGINFIDTSIDYGRSEEMIGKYISHRRSEYLLASKCGCVYQGKQGEHVHTAENVRFGVENSLRLMRTDYLDLVQFHRSLLPGEFEDQGGLEEALKLRDEGKVRFVGMSATLPHMDGHIQMDIFDAFQVPYSVLQREHEDVIGRASEAGAGIIIRGGVARGSPDDWARSNYMLPGQMMRDRWEEARLDELLSDGMSRIEFTLRFTLSNPYLDTTIVGTKNLEHLRDNVEFALKGALPADVIAEAKRRLDFAVASTP